jgi:outer membrane protein
MNSKARVHKVIHPLRAWPLATVLVLFAYSSGAAESVASSGRPTPPSPAPLKNLQAPASPDREWQPPSLRSYAAVLHEQEPLPIEPNKEYELADLIDLAQRVNPETRVAWERARIAAAAVGLAQSEYYPMLALKTSANWINMPVPLPKTVIPSTYFELENQSVKLMGALEWVLLDFGRRRSVVAGAKERLLAANLGFNSQHQTVVFKVQRAFYALSIARGRIRVVESSQAAARKVLEAAEARSLQGLATAPEVYLARQQAIQAEFDLAEATARERNAYVLLAESVGISPTTPIRVADFSRLPLPATLEQSVEQLIDRTLEQRPDLLARVAILRERDAEIRKARASYYPVVKFVGEAGGTAVRDRLSFENFETPAWSSTVRPSWGLGVALVFPLFEGGARAKKMDIAKASRAAAEYELKEARDQAISQVWKSYTDAKLALQRLGVAAALVAVSEQAYEGSLQSYQNGLGSLVELLAARRELDRARQVELETKAAVLESSAALAFSSGDPGTDSIKRRTAGSP